MKRAVVIGSGLAGLGAAWSLARKDVTTEIFEKESRPGGLCRTEQSGNFLFDYTGHLLHFRNELFKKIVFSCIGHNLQKRNRSAWIYSKSVYTRYPFQVNLYGLPVDVITDCIYEYSRQFFTENKGGIHNFEDWIHIHFGKGIADHFMVPYNAKLYKRHPRELNQDCGGRFVPQSDLKLLLRGALTDDSGQVGYNSEFYYPDKGGIEAMVGGLCRNFQIHTNEKVVKIHPSKNMITTSQGRDVPFDILISTQPVPELVQSVDGDIDRVRDSAEKLRWVSVLNVNLGIRRINKERHWVYVPEERFLFHRIGFTNNFSDYMAPAGHSSLYLEMSYDPQSGINHEWAVRKSISDLITMGLIQDSDDVVTTQILDLPFAYVIFDHERKSRIQEIRTCMENAGIFTAGRFGSWEYSSMEDAFMDGWGAAEKAFERSN